MSACVQVRSFIDDAYKRTVGLLREKKDLVDKMAQVWSGYIPAVMLQDQLQAHMVLKR